MGLKDRLLQFIDYTGLEIAVFERSIGLSNGAGHKMGEGTRNSTIDKISVKYPDLNIVWLKTGVGNMLLSDERNEKTITVNQTAISPNNRKGALIYDIDATCGLNGRDIYSRKSDRKYRRAGNQPGIKDNIRYRR